ncbi:hypothetical protein [Marinicella sp. W31]|uniref:hypothetical protein n=1 Tax=Marinicella sp. W31 TaxID=3023713 RepID=UPI00375781E4
MNTNTRQYKNMNKRHLIGILFFLLINTINHVSAQEMPILEMTTYSSKLSKPDLTPNVSIYKDGVIEIYRPIYMKNSGLFSGQLNREQLSEIHQLMDSLEQFDVIKAEENYINADLNESGSTDLAFYNSETIITQFIINRTGHSSSSEQLFLAESARVKSTRFTHLKDWKMFADAELMMMALSESLNLTRIGDANE